mmetsp:Transcript_17705/g.36541  ORF Transcript_17705/g.36541 Transcript_17705/m.36541 type:complete len:203 (+) Transcript_17705:103-711(+)
MALTGTVKAFNPHKGWGFVECNGTDMFMHKKDLNGFCPSKGDQVQFTVGQTEKGPVAENVRVVRSPEEAAYFGQIKSYNPTKGFGFISTDAFPEQDVFVLRSELPGGFGPEGGQCKFSVSMDEKGPAAKRVMLLGSAGTQVQQMKWMMGYGGWGKGFGKGLGKSGDKTCWDVKKTGTCPRLAKGEPCKFSPCNGEPVPDAAD